MRRAMLAALGLLWWDIKDERMRQQDKHGDQGHLPDGTGGLVAVDAANRAKALTDRHAVTGDLTWKDILDEEVREAFAEGNPVLVREELIQVAAVALAWIAAIDSRSQTKPL